MKDDRLEAEAAEWIVRIDLGLSASEQDEFLEWLTAAPEHREEFLRQKGNWQRLDILADWRPEHSTQPNRDLLAPRRAPFWTPFRRVALSLAAAAMLVLGFTLWRELPRAAASDARIATIEERTLPDGSTLALNRNADVQVDYTPAERRVHLTRGEATFTVAKNPQRPFIVSVGAIDVRAVGTAFNVRRGAKSVEVLVTEGRVAVLQEKSQSSPEALASIGAGERAVVPLDHPVAPQVSAVTAAQRDELLAWQPQWLDFTAEPLQRVVGEFNRRNAPIHLVIVDAELADLRVNAALRSDNIENFVHLAETSLGVRVQREGQTLLLRKAR